MKEVIELLRKTDKELDDWLRDVEQYQASGAEGFMAQAAFRGNCEKVQTPLKQALALLQEPKRKLKLKCSVCGEDWKDDHASYCKGPKEQPSTSEFTKKARKEFDNHTNWPDWAIHTILMEACDRLDRAEEKNKQLKGEEPIPDAWWKETPKLAQKTMERIIDRNSELEAENKQQAERIQELEEDSSLFRKINNSLFRRSKELEATASEQKGGE